MDWFNQQMNMRSSIGNYNKDSNYKTHTFAYERDIISYYDYKIRYAIDLRTHNRYIEERREALRNFSVYGAVRIIDNESPRISNYKEEQKQENQINRKLLLL